MSLLMIIKSTDLGAIFYSEFETKLRNNFVKILPEEIIKIAEKQGLIRITPVEIPEIFLRIVTITKKGENYIQPIR